jgi:WD40 repeat protein
VKLWDVSAGQRARPLRTPGSRVIDLAFLPDSRQLAVAGSDCRIRIWDVRTGKEIRSLAHPQPLSGLAVGPECRLAAVCMDNSVHVWDGQTGEELRVLRPALNAPPSPQLPVAGPLSVAFSPDGLLVAASAGNYDTDAPAGAWTVWNVGTGEQLCTGTIRGQWWGGPVAFSPAGRFLAVIDEPKTVSVHAVPSGEEVLRFRGSEQAVWHIAFRPDGRQVAVAGVDGFLHLWDMELPGPGKVGSVVQTASVRQRLARNVDFSPDGRRLVSGGDPAVVIRDAGTGRELLTLGGHRHFVQQAVFSPDGHFLASADSGGFVLLWDGSPLDDAH